MALLEANVIDQLILNDLDKGVYNLFKAILISSDDLINKIQNTIITKEEYFRCKDIVLNELYNSDLIDNAWAFLVNNRLSFSGIYNAGMQGGKYGLEKDLLARWNNKTIVKKIDTISNLSNRITLINSDGIDVIEEWMWKRNTTIYVDPPYVKQGKNLYQKYYQKQDHVALMNFFGISIFY